MKKLFLFCLALSLPVFAAAMAQEEDAPKTCSSLYELRSELISEPEVLIYEGSVVVTMIDTVVDAEKKFGYIYVQDESAAYKFYMEDAKGAEIARDMLLGKFTIKREEIETSPKKFEWLYCVASDAFEVVETSELVLDTASFTVNAIFGDFSALEAAANAGSKSYEDALVVVKSVQIKNSRFAAEPKTYFENNTFYCMIDESSLAGSNIMATIFEGADYIGSDMPSEKDKYDVYGILYRRGEDYFFCPRDKDDFKFIETLSVSRCLDREMPFVLCPKNGRLQITLDASLFGARMSLVDASGRIVRDEKVASSAFEIDGLGVGVYVLNLKRGKENYSRKVVIK